MSQNQSPLMIVDDEVEFSRALEMTLKSNGYSGAFTVNDSTRALDELRRRGPALAILDVMMPGIGGLELLRRLKEERPDLPCLMLTAVMDVSTAVECIRLGASNYLLKPVDEEQICNEIRNLLDLRRLEEENILLRDKLLNPGLERAELFRDILTVDPGMRAVLAYVEAIAPSSQCVLITGETGTGKELIAHALHRASGAAGPLVIANAGGLDDQLFSDTLFGHKKGAYTGADRDRPGLVEQAAGGTVFLDEIGDLSPASQIKLLRLLQQREFMPLGSDQPRKTDARFIFATHHNLKVLQKEGRFRADLFFRLKTHNIRLPPLRERPGDLPLLSDHFLQKAAATMGKAAPPLPEKVLESFRSYHFPGNVRELEAILTDSVLQTGGREIREADVLSAMELEDYPLSAPAAPPSLNLPSGTLPTLREASAQLVTEALRRTGGNMSQAASLLGISRQALHKKLKGKSEDEE